MREVSTIEFYCKCIFSFQHDSITGIVLVTLSDSKSKAGGISVGALWALASAFL